MLCAVLYCTVSKFCSRVDKLCFPRKCRATPRAPCDVPFIAVCQPCKLCEPLLSKRVGLCLFQQDHLLIPCLSCPHNKFGTVVAQEALNELFL